MQINRRFQWNYALENAVEWANRLQKPLLIYEGLRSDYPWASDRIHQFVLQGMRENQLTAMESGWNYYCFVERSPGEGKGLVRSLANDACLLVTDEFPVFVIRQHNEKLGPAYPIPYITVDSNGIVPQQLSSKAPYSAFQFRKIMQKHFVNEFKNGPQKNPMAALQNTDPVQPSESILSRWPDGSRLLDDIQGTIAKLPIDHSVRPVSIEGTRNAALGRFKSFVRSDLLDYGKLRNHPDLEKTSNLSPYLHFGKIASFEIVKSVLAKQPEGWTMNRIAYARGGRHGFFNGNFSVDAFLDQVVTWRELGYHFCHHNRNYNAFESLPDWSKKTLRKHASDKREHLYDLQTLERAETYDQLWNAAQRQLLEDGFIHNYLRMIWGKRILEWTPDPVTALDYLIEINNKYSIDGRNPNSYSGIFWILGRFDRPWAPEREIFGTVRYMSSQNTIRKLKLKKYLEKWGTRN
jgi:deoxyribodipyrimidine photo-lyase